MMLQLGQLPLNSSELSKARRRGQRGGPHGKGVRQPAWTVSGSPRDPRQVCSASPTGGAEESWAGQHLYPVLLYPVPVPQYPCAQHLYPVPLCTLCPVSPHP